MEGRVMDGALSPSSFTPLETRPISAFTTLRGSAVCPSLGVGSDASLHFSKTQFLADASFFWAVEPSIAV